MSKDGKRNDILVAVTEYFTSAKFMLIYPIIMGEDVISMSIINYTVTNYSKDFSTYIMIDESPLYINTSYKSKLDEDGKDLFDPFCRTVKFPFYYNRDEYVITTAGQLNFYKWALQIGLLDYIRDNFDDIVLHMKLKTKRAKAKKLANSDSACLTTTSETLTDSDLTTSEKNRYKNKVLVTKRIKTKFELF